MILLTCPLRIASINWSESTPSIWGAECAPNFIPIPITLSGMRIFARDFSVAISVKDTLKNLPSPLLGSSACFFYLSCCLIPKTPAIWPLHQPKSCPPAKSLKSSFSLHSLFTSQFSKGNSPLPRSISSACSGFNAP